MSVKKIKGSKQKFETTEEVLTFSERANEFIKKNPYWIAATAGCIVLLLAVAWGVNAYWQAKEGRARAEYWSVVAKWPSANPAPPESWAAMVQPLKDFIKQNGGVTPALNAQLDLAQVYYQMQRYDDSIEVTNRLLDELSASSPLLPLARYHLAVSYEAAGKIDNAISQWSALAASKIEGLEREIHWRLAKLYSAKKEYAKAVEEYENALKVTSGYPDTGLIQQEQSVARLKIEPTAKENPAEPAKQNSSG